MCFQSQYQGAGLEMTFCESEKGKAWILDMWKDINLPSPRTHASVRKGNIDISRFIASLLIMKWHRTYAGAEWAWVEYFFILSGYFAMVFAQNKIGKVQQPGKISLQYTVKKFVPYMPFVFAAVLLRYLIDAWPLFKAGMLRKGIRVFAYIPFELLFLSSTGVMAPEIGQVDGRLATIWYLSAMFIVLPIVLYLIMRFEDAWLLVCWIVPVLYYGHMGVNVIRGFPNDFYRAFCAMAMGSGLYYLVERMKRIHFSRWQKIVLTVIEISAFIISISITVEKKSYFNLLILLFPVIALLALSGCTYTAHIHGRLCTFLAKMSLPMYLFHWDVYFILVKYTLTDEKHMLLYYSMTILMSIAMVLIVDMIKHTFNNIKMIKGV